VRVKMGLGAIVGDAVARVCFRSRKEVGMEAARRNGNRETGRRRGRGKIIDTELSRRENKDLINDDRDVGNDGLGVAKYLMQVDVASLAQVVVPL
jgi:hypothetical protein